MCILACRAFNYWPRLWAIMETCMAIGRLQYYIAMKHGLVEDNCIASDK